MFLCAAHTRGKVLETVHVQPATAVAWREDALSFSEALHAVNHLCFERATVIFVLWLLSALTCGREETRGCVRYWNGRVHDLV